MRINNLTNDNSGLRSLNVMSKLNSRDAKCCSPVNFESNGDRLHPVLHHVVEVTGVLHDEGHNGEEGEEQHVEHVHPLACN